MARLISQYVCQSCGSVTPKWMGKCPDCGEWNTLLEEVVESGTKKKTDSAHLHRQPATASGGPQPLKSIRSVEGDRVQTHFAEFNRVMGGGIMSGSLNLIGGDPGIGKSTLMMQMTGSLPGGTGPVLYVSAEESVFQIKNRAERLGVDPDNLFLLAETNLSQILDQCRKLNPALLIIDSIQTVYLPDLASAPGSVSQVRECAAAILTMAKSAGITTFLTGHVTKDGNLAGPRVLEHLVDTVLQFEGDRNHQFRILRALKNRYGSTNEIGVFDMGPRGLTEIPNPASWFISEFSRGIPGSVIGVTMEGTRPLLVEIQSLVTPCNYGFAQRNANGLDSRRLTMLIAVLEKRLGIPLGTQDIFLNVASGFRLEDPGVDLAVCAAILSSFREWPVARQVCLIGEVGLGGEIRPVANLDQRLQEARKLGFRHLLTSPGHSQTEGVVTIHSINDLYQSLDGFLEPLI
ncbi:MAG: DNA repair protein RadA [Bacteroidetes bacterium]|nr:DNA repair protein RadA [Bacteroidota bacterium]